MSAKPDAYGTLTLVATGVTRSFCNNPHAQAIPMVWWFHMPNLVRRCRKLTVHKEQTDRRTCFYVAINVCNVKYMQHYQLHMLSCQLTYIFLLFIIIASVYSRYYALCFSSTARIPMVSTATNLSVKNVLVVPWMHVQSMLNFGCQYHWQTYFTLFTFFSD